MIDALIFGTLFLFLWLILFAAVVGGLVFWIVMIVDVANRKFKKEDDKTVWVLIVILAGIVGALVYYFMIKRKNKK